MGLDDVFVGLDSLWDAEQDNAEWDERREVARAERAQRTVCDELMRIAREQPVSAGIRGIPHTVHLSTIGANWVEGFACGVHSTILAPTPSLLWGASGWKCDCSTSPPRVVEHVPLTARLRAVERVGAEISVSLPSGGVRGRVVAVWRDGVYLQSGVLRFSVPLASVEFVTLDRA